MSRFDAHNKKVLKIKLKEEEGKIIQKISTILFSVADKIRDYIDSADDSTLNPIWSGNLRDSIGVGVYINGALSKFTPSKRATRTQQYGDTKNIDGSDELNEALSQGSLMFSKGIWLVIFAAVPYAFKITTEGSPRNRGIGFFEDLKKLTIDEVITNFKRVQ